VDLPERVRRRPQYFWGLLWLALAMVSRQASLVEVEMLRDSSSSRIPTLGSLGPVS
jgi:hypothetical protein